MINFATGKHYIDVLKQYCPRCAMHHLADRDSNGEWSHGTDDIGNGVYAYPEPCTAAPARELYLRLVAMTGEKTK